MTVENNSGLNTTYLLISEEKERKGRERELSGEELAKRITNEKCLSCIWRLVYEKLKATEFCIILLCCNRLFALDLLKHSCYQDSFVILGWRVYWVLTKGKLSKINFFQYFTSLDGLEGWKIFSHSGLT